MSDTARRVRRRVVFLLRPLPSGDVVALEIGRAVLEPVETVWLDRERRVPVGAFGGKEEVMDRIADGVAHFGTYNGNPFVLRALVTQLREVLTDAAYDHVDETIEAFKTVAPRLAGEQPT